MSNVFTVVRIEDEQDVRAQDIDTVIVHLADGSGTAYLDRATTERALAAMNEKLRAEATRGKKRGAW